MRGGKRRMRKMRWQKENESRKEKNKISNTHTPLRVSEMGQLTLEGKKRADEKRENIRGNYVDY